MRIWIIFLLVCLPVTLAAGVQADLRTSGKLYKQKKYGQALAGYNAILKEHPANQEAALGAGASAYYLKDYKTAQTAFHQAAEMQAPRATDALFNLGNAFYRAKDSDQAQQAFRQAILRNPQDKEAIHNLQLLLQEKQSQNNQNNKNNQNQDKNSNNQQPQSGQSPQSGNEQPQEQEKQNQQPQPSDADQEAAQKVMQMAQEQEAKQNPQKGPGALDNLVEKDW